MSEFIDGGELIEVSTGGRKVLFSIRDIASVGDVSSFSGTGISLSRKDGGTIIQSTSADPVSITVRPAAQMAVRAGTRISIVQMGAGQVTIVAGAGVTISTPETLKLAKQYATATLINLSTNAWVLAGYLEAA